MELGDVIKYARLEKCFNQSELAKQVGVSKETISRIENGKCKQIHGSTLRGLAATLNLEISFLLQLYANDFEYTSSLGGIIKLARIEKDISVEELAQKVNLSTTAIRYLENGVRQIQNKPAFKKILEILELDACKISDIYQVKCSNNCLGERIVKARLKQNINQRKLARLSGIKQPSLSLIETGKNYKPYDKTLRKISSILNIDFDELKKLRECQIVLRLEAL